MPYSFISRDALKDRLGDTLTTDDVAYRAILEAVSRRIEHETSQRFQVHTATRYLSATWTNSLMLRTGMLSVTTLKTDDDGDRTYETTWATTDYDLIPLNAVGDLKPFTSLDVAPAGTKTFPVHTRSTELVGSWGYFQDLETVSSALNEALDSSETAVDVVSGAAYEVLQTILIDTEQMYITAISTNTLTVERAVNGTTAATHDNGAAIQRYRYPSPIVEAAAISAVRIFRRKDTPFGVVGGSDLSFPRNIPEMDPDVKRLIAPYRRTVMSYA